ncbi:MAG: hypothetical protein EXS35_16315 [Pedosphaera sp.]|nr:hypothetical protein [Pedosphaera sp.]
MNQDKHLKLWVLVSSLAFAYGCASFDRPLESKKTGSNDNQPLRTGEVLEIHFSDHEDRPHAEYLHTIDSGGKILLPIIGNIDIAGLSLDAARERIRTAYVPRYYIRLDVRLARLPSTAKGTRDIGLKTR